MQATDYNVNADLLLRVREGDKKAEEELLKINSGLIRSIALRFRDRAIQNHGCEFDDLMQLGSIGMLKAIKSYNPEFNTAFSTYAVPLIIGEIKRFLRDDGQIKISRNIKKLGAEIMHEWEKFMRREGREPTIDELSDICKLDREELCTALISMSPARSLSEPITNDGCQLEEILSDDKDELDILCDRLALRQALVKLPPLWREIVTLRYFKEYSQQKTAELLGLTQVKVSREEKKIFDKLRGELNIYNNS